jgi:hypothetical protein
VIDLDGEPCWTRTSDPLIKRLSVIYGWRRAARRSATYGSTERRRSWDFLATVALWIAGMIHNLAPQGGQE